MVQGNGGDFQKKQDIILFYRKLTQPGRGFTAKVFQHMRSINWAKKKSEVNAGTSD